MFCCYSASGNFMIFLPNEVETTSENLLTSNSEAIVTQQQSGINEIDILEIEPIAVPNQKLSENRMKQKQEEKENEGVTQNSKRYKKNFID